MYSKELLSSFSTQELVDELKTREDVQDLNYKDARAFKVEIFLPKAKPFIVIEHDSTEEEFKRQLENMQRLDRMWLD